MGSNEQLRQRFADVVGAQHLDCYPAVLEQQFPHVLETILAQWGSFRLNDYFKGLLVTERTNRQGFPSAASTEIFRLFTLHNGLGQTEPRSNSPATGWNWIERLDYFDEKAAGEKDKPS